MLRAVLLGGHRATAWRDDAACLEVGTEAFYPDMSHRDAVAVAKAVCTGCPVRAQCLVDVLGWEASGRRHGIVGGLTPHERERLMTTYRPDRQGGGVAA